MQGIALSQQFHDEIVRPFLANAAPGLRSAAALIGYGSELLGFDDETSRDHNWGPRVLIFVSEADFARHADRLVAEFVQAMPTRFAGEPIGWRSRPHPPASGPGAMGHAAHGLEFHVLSQFMARQLGVSSVTGLSALDWLGFAEQRLLAFTAGAVFHDDDGALTHARAALSRYPRDVRLYKIACQWRRIAEEQAFVGRTGQVGDALGSRIEAARLTRDVMRMAFLLEGRYAPYPKWLGSGFARLSLAEVLTPALAAALGAEDWSARQDHLATAYLALAAYQVAAGLGQPVTPVLGPYYDRPFTTINADDLVAASMGAISDPWLRELPVMGALDQLSDLTPLLEDPQTARRIMAALYAAP
ncbi:DUF4037 domain-containing protein [Devosia sp.]|uniref:DUF4037 domain-containing protein n=1 Tax=Devosia sp. TaxID=1871048 RepID=UPI003A8C95AC